MADFGSVVDLDDIGFETAMHFGIATGFGIAMGNCFDMVDPCFEPNFEV